MTIAPKPRRGAPKGHPRWGGRKKGTLNNRTVALRAARDRAVQLVNEGDLAPIDVMYDNMVYAHTESEKAARVLREMSEAALRDLDAAADGAVNGEAYEIEQMRAQVASVHAEMDQFLRVQTWRDRSQKYAADLAPYVSPRLSAVAVKSVEPEDVRTAIAVEYVAHDPAEVAPPAPRVAPPETQETQETQE